MSCDSDAARDWVLQQVREQDLGPVLASDAPRVRPWATTTRWLTAAGALWFKAAGPGTLHEPALLQLLGRRAADLVPEVVAVDRDLGWSLTRDAGPLLREQLAPEASWSAWEVVVRRYAELQLRLTGERDAVLACGVREVSPRTVPEQASALVADLSTLTPDAGGLVPAEVDRLAAALPRLAAWCAELAASPVADSIQHDDLHSGNVCWTGTATDTAGGGTGQRLRVIDWGDATWGFPLTTMLTTLSSVAFRAGLPSAAEEWVLDPPAPGLRRLRDAYLEPFTACCPAPDLLRLLDLACRTGCVGRALCYRAALAGAPLASHRELGFPVRAWLLRLLDVPPALPGSDR